MQTLRAKRTGTCDLAPNVSFKRKPAATRRAGGNG
jgi:hypothetical protein